MISTARAAESHSRIRLALLHAIKQGDLPGTARLLHRSSALFRKELLDSTFDAEGVPPLHLACKHGHLNVAKLLVEQGAQASATDADPKRRGTAIA